MNKKPLISVNMVTYDREKYIEATIKSILNQTYKHIELIIVDDGSTDNTGKIINAFNSNKIKYISIEHSGQANARNIARKHCKGDCIIFVDSDDICLPALFQTEVKMLMKNPDVSVIYPNFILIDKDSKECGKRQFKSYKRETLIREMYARGANVTPFPSMMITRELSDLVGDFDTDSNTSMDSIYIANLIKHGEFRHIDVPLYKYRKHKESASSIASLEQKNYELELTRKKMRIFFSKRELFEK